MIPFNLAKPFRIVAPLLFAVVVTAVAAEPLAERRVPESAKLRRWTNLSRASREVPLFVIYGPFEQSPDPAALRNAKSALDVYDFQEVALSEDDKGITFQLSDRDRRVLAQRAQTQQGRWFVAVAPGNKNVHAAEYAIAATKLTPEMLEGRIVFPHPQCAAVAQSLRRRLRLAEFRKSSR